MIRGNIISNNGLHSVLIEMSPPFFTPLVVCGASLLAYAEDS